MKKIKIDLFLLVSFLICVTITYQTTAQKTKIRGFIEANTSYEDDIWSFGSGEQDLFITSEINDEISFLGETVFKYSSSSSKFEVSVERVVINYNYKGNHNFLIGKHHTPINYWNDTYHHGRVFFPTIDRPLLFTANIIPIHTTGIAFQGLNLGKLKFGYNLMIGNGIGSEEIEDNDKYKSVTAAVNIKPIENLQFGLTYYNDVISEGSDVHGNHFIALENIKQQLLTATVAYFGNKFEVLAEGTFSSNKGDVLGTTNAFISYIYGGVKLKEKWVPYIRLDNLHFNEDEFFFNTPNNFSNVCNLTAFQALTKTET